MIFSQNDGMVTFGTNQVIRVDIQFNQTSFWDSLTANYQIEKDMVAASVTITDLDGIHELDSVNVRLKGNSSYGHPGNKKSFKMDFNDYVSGQNYDGLKKLNFNNNFKDPTFMREKIFFDLCKVIGLPAPRVNYANVYMNDTFWGFYTYIEQIDDQFLDWAILDDNGNLFKAGDNSNGSTPADLKYYGTDQSTYYSRYELNTNEDVNDWSDLISLIDFINNASDIEFESELANHVSLTKLLQSFAMDNLFSNLDSYLNSARNYYIYHNSTTNLWEWIKWDANECFGSYSGGPGSGNLEQLAPNYAANSRPLLNRIMQIPGLYSLYEEQLCYLMNTYFQSSYIDPKIEEIKSLIQTHVENDNLKMYTTQQFYTNIESNITGGMGNQTTYGLKSFVQNRLTYLEGVVSCELSTDDLIFNDINIFPNPFKDEFILSGNAEIIGVTDLSGRQLDITISQDQNNQHVSFEGEKGMYYLMYKMKDEVKVYSIIKE